MSDIQFTVHVDSAKPAQRRKRRSQKRRTINAAEAKARLEQMGMNGFLSFQQAEIVIMALGVKDV
jgi:succinylarginine dihydrolase